MMMVMHTGILLMFCQPLSATSSSEPPLSSSSSSSSPPPQSVLWKILHPNQNETVVSPTVRYGHSAVVVDSDLMVSTHGYFYNHRHHHPDWRDDSWAYSLTEGWFQRIQLTSTDNPKAAFYPTSIAYKGDVFMFGGDHMQGNGNQGHTFGTGCNLMWRLTIDPLPSYPRRFIYNNLVAPVLKRVHRMYAEPYRMLFQVTGRWQLMHQGGQGAPANRSCHAAARIGKIMYVHGGFHHSDMWAFHLEDLTWDRIHDSTDEGPGSRFGHTIVGYDNKIWLYGGNQWGENIRDKARSDVWFLDPNTEKANRKWRFIGDGGGIKEGSSAWPPVRAHHAAALDHMTAMMYVYGGLRCPDGPCSCREDTWQYDLKRNKWRQLSTGNNPTSRYSHSMVFWNDALYVFGGESMVPYMYHNEIKSLPLAKWTQDEL